MRHPAFLLLAVTFASSCLFDLSRDLGPGELRGTLLFEDAGGLRTPAGGAIVSVEASGVRVKADAEGRFVVRGLPAGTYGLRVEHDVDGDGGVDAGLRLRDLTLSPIPQGGAGRDLGIIVVGGLGTVDGTLVRNGVNAAGRIVLGLSRETDATEGAFTMTGLLPGVYDIAARDATGAIVRKQLEIKPREATAASFDFSVDRFTTGSVSGRVRLSGSMSHDGVRVSIAGEGSEAYSSEDGTFLLPAARAGIYSLVFEVDGFLTHQLAGVIVGDETFLGDVVLVPSGAGCALGGTAASETDQDGDGSADATEPANCRCEPGVVDVDADGLCDHADRDLDNDGTDDGLEPDDNRPPVAGTPPSLVSLVGRRVKLDVPFTDPDGDTLTFTWTQDAGPVVTLDAPTAAAPAFVPRGVGVYDFSVTASDGRASAQGTARVTVHDVDGAESHSVALKPDGTLLAWGSGFDGRLGNGGTTNAATPGPVCAPGATNCLENPFVGVVAIASGRGHTLALKADGSVWAWGSNYDGELGDGTQVVRLTPVPVCADGTNADCAANPMRDVVAIAAGYRYSVALKSDGTVWSWGYNYEGQLANVDSSSISAFPVPACAPGASGATTPCSRAAGNILERIVRVSAGGGGHTLALDDAGALWSWGHNKNAQAGNGDWNVQRINSPIRVCAPGATAPCTSYFDGAVELDAWSGHSLAVDADGRAFAWGSNDTSELGLVCSDTCVGGAACSQVPRPVCTSGDDPCTAPLTGVASVVAGRRFSLGLMADGTVRAWGSNTAGQVGDGTTDLRAVPTPVCAVGAAPPCNTFLGDVAAIAAGNFHAFALTRAGQLVGWGDNGSGQLGVGDLDPAYVPRPVTGY